jgi:hypothetical protein
MTPAVSATATAPAAEAMTPNATVPAAMVLMIMGKTHLYLFRLYLLTYRKI